LFGTVISNVEVILVDNSFTSLSGSDTYIVLGGELVGGADKIFYRVQRQKTPVFTFGSVDPVTFGRGVRMVAGTLENIVISTGIIEEMVYAYYKSRGFDKESQFDIFKLYDNSEKSNYARTFKSVFGFDIVFGNETGDDTRNGLYIYPEVYEDGTIKQYRIPSIILDQLPPVDMVVIQGNEAGEVSKMVLHDVEFTSNEIAIAVDGVAPIQTAEFVGRSSHPLESLI
jgi:hypothetical protein